MHEEIKKSTWLALLQWSGTELTVSLRYVSRLLLNDSEKRWQYPDSPQNPLMLDNCTYLKEPGRRTVQQKQGPRDSVEGSQVALSLFHFLPSFFNFSKTVKILKCNKDYTVIKSILLNLVISSVQSLSRVQLWDPMNHSMLGLPVHHQFPEFTQTHVHRVRDAIQPSHPWLSPSPPAPNPSQHQGLFQWVNFSHEVVKILELQL